MTLNSDEKSKIPQEKLRLIQRGLRDEELKTVSLEEMVVKGEAPNQPDLLLEIV